MEPNIGISNKYALEPLGSGVVLVPKFSKKKSAKSEVGQDAHYRFVLPTAAKQVRIEKAIAVDVNPLHDASIRKTSISDNVCNSARKALSKRKKDYQSYDPEEEFDDIPDF